MSAAILVQGITRESSKQMEKETRKIGIKGGKAEEQNEEKYETDARIKINSGFVENSKGSTFSRLESARFDRERD